MRNLLLLSSVILVTSANSALMPRAESLTLQIKMESGGTIAIKLNSTGAPKAVERITSLAKSGFYDGQKFFKVVKSPKPFLVQFGDPNSRNKSMDDPDLGKYKTGVQVPFEDSGLKHVRGAVGLARLGENKNSGDTQFYIMLDSAPFLDGQYTVFGNVSSGMNVVDGIKPGDTVVSVKVVSE
ncbi:MAG: peptidylprolyl isomerase [Armatimonadetes bacterium]|nr:peptidylprolyl isomerase [Armatimonadota bacterium]